MLAQIRREENYHFKIIGLGGVTRPEDFVEMREAGADVVEAVTGAMVNPYLAHEIDERVMADARI
jgi:dihydroorotate dehydrogenase